MLAEVKGAARKAASKENSETLRTAAIIAEQN
jgi:hypothetical protein